MTLPVRTLWPPGCDTEVTGAGVVALECKAPEAASSGPLQRVTVAATAHRMLTAMALPPSLRMGSTLVPKYWGNACAS